jgi:hypothetical protein
MIRKKKKEVSNQAFTLNTAVETSSQFHNLKTKSTQTPFAPKRNKAVLNCLNAT